MQTQGHFVQRGTRAPRWDESKQAERPSCPQSQSCSGAMKQDQERPTTTCHPMGLGAAAESAAQECRSRDTQAAFRPCSPGSTPTPAGSEAALGVRTGAGLAGQLCLRLLFTDIQAASVCQKRRAMLGIPLQAEGSPRSERDLEMWPRSPCLHPESGAPSTGAQQALDGLRAGSEIPGV